MSPAMRNMTVRIPPELRELATRAAARLAPSLPLPRAVAGRVGESMRLPGMEGMDPLLSAFVRLAVEEVAKLVMEVPDGERPALPSARIARLAEQVVELQRCGACGAVAEMLPEAHPADVVEVGHG